MCLIIDYHFIYTSCFTISMAITSLKRNYLLLDKNEWLSKHFQWQSCAPLSSLLNISSQVSPTRVRVIFHKASSEESSYRETLTDGSTATMSRNIGIETMAGLCSHRELEERASDVVIAIMQVVRCKGDDVAHPHYTPSHYTCLPAHIQLYITTPNILLKWVITLLRLIELWYMYIHELAT